MARWRFYQGLRTEWRWYHVDDHGSVIAESDQGFAELQGCMANAEASGFGGEAFHVYTRQAGSLGDTHPLQLEDAADEMLLAPGGGGADEQPAP
ncbi:MAG TPA: hypothetical protein VFB75_01415 [Burkholderiales bacterium]|nr:hypothetical protein [Burkholderiales bacterium]